MLTNLQRALVEQNLHIPKIVMARCHMPSSEYLDVAYEGLCLAARDFKYDPAHFFSYAYRCIYHALMRATRWKVHHGSLDDVPLTVPDSFADVEDQMFADAVIEQSRPYMTDSEIKAMMRIMQGQKSRNASESGSRDRALKKYRALLNGEPIEKINRNCSMPAEARKKRDEKVVHLMGIGYHCSKAASMCGVSERQARLAYEKAGHPKEKTASYWARVLSVDRSTVLAYSANAPKCGNVYRIEERPAIKKRQKNHSKCYCFDEKSLLLSEKTDSEISKLLGRSENAVHIARWRLRKRSA